MPIICDTGDWRTSSYECPEWCDWKGLGHELDRVVSETRIEFKCPKCDEPVHTIYLEEVSQERNRSPHAKSEEERIDAGGNPAGTQFRFWFSDTRGLIRQRRTDEAVFHPEVSVSGKWVTGSAYVMDAISGMGEDPWSCGEWADDWNSEQAEDYARRFGIELYGPVERQCEESERQNDT